MSEPDVVSCSEDETEAYLACRMFGKSNGAIALYHVMHDTADLYSIDWVGPYDDSYTFYLNAHDLNDAIDRATRGTVSDAWCYDNDVKPMARLTCHSDELGFIEWAAGVDHERSHACARPCDMLNLTPAEPITRDEYLGIAEDYADYWHDRVSGYDEYERHFNPHYFVGDDSYVSVFGVTDGSRVAQSDLISYMCMYDRDDIDFDHKLCLITVCCTDEPVYGDAHEIYGTVHEKPWTCEAQVFTNDPETGELTSFWIGEHKTVATSWEEALKAFPFIERHAGTVLNFKETDDIDSGPDKPQFANAVAPYVKDMGLTMTELGLPEEGITQ